MNPMKRLGMAVLLVVGVMLCTGTTAQAAKAETRELTNTGVEPDASGTVSYNYKANSLTVKCEGLRPLSTYVVVYYVWYRVSFQGTFWEEEYYDRRMVETDKKGTLTTKVPIQSSSSDAWGSSATTQWFECVENDADPPQVVLW
jgi:hypothetical protein